MAAPEASTSNDLEPSTLTGAEQEQTILLVLEKSLESIIHNILVDVHRTEKSARTQSAVIEIQQKAGRLEKRRALLRENGETVDEDEPVETVAAVLKDGKVTLKGNPLTTVKDIICPDCLLPRLLYPRVGFNSRPPPNPNQQYCKNEPPIVLDKHDVHGQRKKGVKMKAPKKGKAKKKDEVASPASSTSSGPGTQPSTSQDNDAFELKEINYPAAKCPNPDSHLDEHWKSVNIFATHLNGNCYLKRDRASGREAAAKIGGTPKDSRASSPKAANGIKRARVGDESEEGSKKKQKPSTPKKIGKKSVPPPSKLCDSQTSIDEDASKLDSSMVEEVDAADLSNKTYTSVQRQTNGVGDVQMKPKPNGIGTALKIKATKLGKKVIGAKEADLV